MVILGHGEFLGEEVRRARGSEFVATFRRSRSAACDTDPHQHEGPHLILPLDEGYSSDAVGFEAGRAPQLIYTPALAVHRDSMARLGGRYLCASFPAELTDDLQIAQDPVAVKRPGLIRIAHALAFHLAAGGNDELTVEDACWRLLSELCVIDSRYEPRRVTDAVSFCRENLDRPIRIADVGRAVGLNAAHLSRLFRCAFGCSLSRYIAWLRFEAAAADLRRGKHSIAQIAAKFGYVDQSHLCRAFRSMLGVPPSIYRAAFN